MRRMRPAAILLGLTLLLLGCGSGLDAHRPPVVVTQQDQFHTVRVDVGAVVEVRLRTLAGFNPWSRPLSSDTAILAPVDASQQQGSTKRLTIADYRAIRAGTVRLESGAAVHCDPFQMCPQLVRAWMVSIHVE